MILIRTISVLMLVAVTGVSQAQGESLRCQSALSESQSHLKSIDHLVAELGLLVQQSSKRHVDLEILQLLQSEVQPTITQMSRLLAQGTQASSGMLQGEKSRKILQDTKEINKDLLKFARLYNGELHLFEKLQSLIPGVLASGQKKRVKKIKLKVGELQELHSEVQLENYVLTNLDQTLREHQQKIGDLVEKLENLLIYFSKDKVRLQFGALEQEAIKTVLLEAKSQIDNLNKIRQTTLGMMTAIGTTLKTSRAAFTELNDFLQRNLLPIAVASGQTDLISSVGDTAKNMSTTVVAERPPDMVPVGGQGGRYALDQTARKNFSRLATIATNAEQAGGEAVGIVALRQMQEFESPELIKFNAQMLRKYDLATRIAGDILDFNTSRQWNIDSSEMDRALVERYVAKPQQNDLYLEKIRKYFENKNISESVMGDLSKVFLSQESPLKNRLFALNILLVRIDIDTFRKITDQFSKEKNYQAINEFRQALLKFQERFPKEAKYQRWHEEIGRGLELLKLKKENELSAESLANIELGRKGSFVKVSLGPFERGRDYRDEGLREIVKSHHRDRGLWVYESLMSANFTSIFQHGHSASYFDRIYEAYEILKTEFPQNLTKKDIEDIVSIKGKKGRKRREAAASGALLFSLVKQGYPGVRELIDEELGKKPEYVHENPTLLLARVLYDKYHGEDQLSAGYHEMYKEFFLKEGGSSNFDKHLRALFATVSVNEGVGIIDVHSPDINRNILDYVISPYVNLEQFFKYFENEKARKKWWDDKSNWLQVEFLRDIDYTLLVLEVVAKFEPELVQKYTKLLLSFSNPEFIRNHVGADSPGFHTQDVFASPDSEDVRLGNVSKKLVKKVEAILAKGRVTVPSLEEMLNLSEDEFEKDQYYYLSCLHYLIARGGTHDLKSLSEVLRHLKSLALRSDIRDYIYQLNITHLRLVFPELRNQNTTGILTSDKREKLIQDFLQLRKSQNPNDVLKYMYNCQAVWSLFLDSQFAEKELEKGYVEIFERQELPFEIRKQAALESLLYGLNLDFKTFNEAERTQISLEIKQWSKSLDKRKKEFANSLTDKWFDAVIKGDIKTLETFVALKFFDINSTNFSGYSALLQAAQAEQRGVVEMLVQDPKLDLTSKNQYGYTDTEMLRLIGKSELADWIENRRPESTGRRFVAKERNKDGSPIIDFVEIPAGKFLMGNEASSKVEVTLSKFQISSIQTTNNQWSEVVNLMNTNKIPNSLPKTPSKWKDASLPVESVTYDEVTIWKEGLNILSKMDDVRVQEILARLFPGHFKGAVYGRASDAQGEYVARVAGLADGEFAHGNSEARVGETGWFRENSNDKTHPVGEKKPIMIFGRPIYDMAGNVWEWREDAWDGREPLIGGVDPISTTGSGRVMRGGSWNDYAHRLRSGSRLLGDPGYRNNFVGFRLVRTGL